MNGHCPSPLLTGPASADQGHGLHGSAVVRSTRTILSTAIFKGETEVGIDHHGELYRLKITRQGKLILTK